MAQVINCECGFVVRGDTEEELLQAANAHIGEAHPEMVGKVQDSDLLAMSKEV